MHKPYLFIPLGQGEGQILWTEKILFLKPTFFMRNYASYTHMIPQPMLFNDIFKTYLWPSCVSQF